MCQLGFENVLLTRRRAFRGMSAKTWADASEEYVITVIVCLDMSLSKMVCCYVALCHFILCYA